MKTLLISILTWRVRALIRHFKPKVIAITGSVGKTSTREAIAVVLEDHIDLRTATRNYNNEIGVPLSILGAESPGSNVFTWVKLIMSTFRVRQMPEMLLLEYGIDHPGDMTHLVSIARPDVAVFTSVSEVHAEHFSNGRIGIFEEKSKLIAALPSGGTAILAGDDDLVIKSELPDDVDLLIFGNSKSDIQSKDQKIEEHDGKLLQSAHVLVDGKVDGQLMLKRLGGGAIQASLAAIAVGSLFDISTMEAVKALNKKYLPQAGRLSVLKGVGHSVLVDDSYNAAPASMLNGIRLVDSLNSKGRKIAVLGDMGELGIYSRQRHEEIGVELAKGFDALFAVGTEMKFTADAAVAAGMDSTLVKTFSDSKEAAEELVYFVQEGDTVLVKGSQSMRMERVSMKLLDPKVDPREVLPRQTAKWLQDK